MISSPSFAQAVQNGVVKEYNEKAKKTPLAGVELNVRSANSTVSDAQGAFALNFLTLKPGEKINVRRIEKLGYEIFNKEAIEQWNLNPTTPFLIVMCKSDKFKKIRDNYEKVSSESYARQLKKEEASLAKLKAHGKLKEEEYQKQLFELRENYEKQLDNLENYIDRFSRIDLSELSAIEQEIIELVQQGKIEDAIAKYEEQNYVDKYKREVADLKEVSNAINQLSDVQVYKMQSRDSILAAINRQIETLRIAGGKENFDKIEQLLHNVAYADTTNLSILGKYANFLNEQCFVKEAIIEYEKLIDKYLSYDKSGTDYEKIAIIYDVLGGLWDSKGDFEKAKLYFEQSISLKDSIFVEDNLENLLELNISRHNLGCWYSQHGDFRSAKDILTKVISSRENLAKKDSSKINDYLNSLEVLGIAYCMNGDIKNGKMIFEEIYNKRHDYYLNNPIENTLFDLIETTQNLANCYLFDNQHSLAIGKYKEGLQYIEHEYDNNPDKFKLITFQFNANLGFALLQTGQKEQATDCYRNAIKIATDIRINNGINALYQNLISLLIDQKLFEEAEVALNSGLNLCGEDNLLLASKCILLYEKGNLNSAIKLYREKLYNIKDVNTYFTEIGYGEIFN